jgi:uncharacterized protein DUF664
VVDLGSLVDVANGEKVSVRDIQIHMIEEYARHCGHADLLRECIDGRTGQWAPPRSVGHGGRCDSSAAIVRAAAARHAVSIGSTGMGHTPGTGRPANLPGRRLSAPSSNVGRIPTATAGGR